MQKIKNVLFFFIIAFIFVSFTSCNSNSSHAPQSTEAITLLTYQTPTFIPTALLIPTEPQPTLPPLPSPTPYQYTIQSGDNLSSIALRFNVTLDQIYLSNPNISPNTLSIGQIITIPNSTNDNTQTNALSTEILPLDFSTPICYPNKSNSSWCFVKITNNTSSVAENISLIFYIFDKNNNLITSQIATTPSNILPTQSSTIASYYFSNISNIENINVSLESAIPSQNSSQRYITSNFIQSQLVLSENKNFAQIQGTLQNDSIPTSYSWLIAIAYDKENNPVGYKHWESSDLLQEYPIDITVFSVGGAIDKIEFLTEAR